MAFKKGIRVTRSFILERVREEDIFGKYFGPVVFGYNVRNPSRPDDDPGCRFYIHKGNGRIRFKDFGRGYNWDCFEAAQNAGMTKGMEFIPLLKHIASDFNLLASDVSVDQLLEVKRSYEERIEVANNILEKKIILEDARLKMNWNQRKFWDRFEVTAEFLKKFYVYDFGRAWIRNFYADGTRKDVPIYINPRELRFAYYLGKGEYKLYFPDRDKKTGVKFLQTNANIIQGWYLLPDFGDIVIITKSYKDVIVLGSMSFPAVAPSSESVIMPEDTMEFLFSRFTRVYILFDNDYAGMKGAILNIQEYPRLTPILFGKGEPKDVSDNVDEYGQEPVLKLLTELTAP